MTKKVVAIIGALDTKGAEYAFLKQQIEGQGVGTLMIDVGIFGEPPFAPDISAAEVAKAGGANRAALAAANDRGKAVGAMAAGAAIILKRLYDEGRVHGAIAMGGGGGTTLGSIAMQPLPVAHQREAAIADRAEEHSLHDILRDSQRGCSCFT